MAPTALDHQAAAAASNRTLEEQLSSLSIQEPVGQLLAQLGDADVTDFLPAPALPPEVLERIVFHLQPGAILGDPVAHVTLVRLSCVSRLMRHWAHEALYSIVVLPRHVREFRKWYSQFYAEETGDERTVFPPPYWPEKLDDSPAKATASAKYTGAAKAD